MTGTSTGIGSSIVIDTSAGIARKNRRRAAGIAHDDGVLSSTIFIGTIFQRVGSKVEKDTIYTILKYGN